MSAGRRQRAKRAPRRTLAEDELSRLLARLSRPGLDRWERDTARVRHLLALDAEAVVQRLESKHDQAIGLFSRLRTRDGLVELCRSHFASVSFSDLARLAPDEQQAVQAFHAQLDDLRWYVRSTEDMPSTVRSTVALLLTRLVERHRELTAVIGPAAARGIRVVQGG